LIQINAEPKLNSMIVREPFNALETDVCYQQAT